MLCTHWHFIQKDKIKAICYVISWSRLVQEGYKETPYTKQNRMEFFVNDPCLFNCQDNFLNSNAILCLHSTLLTLGSISQVIFFVFVFFNLVVLKVWRNFPKFVKKVFEIYTIKKFPKKTLAQCKNSTHTPKKNIAL